MLLLSHISFSYYSAVRVIANNNNKKMKFVHIKINKKRRVLCLEKGPFPNEDERLHGQEMFQPRGSTLIIPRKAYGSRS